MTMYVKLFENLLPKAYNCPEKWINLALHQLNISPGKF